MKQVISWGFTPRSYQLDLYKAMRQARYAVCVWHRRAGKDLTALNWMIPQALQVPGIYYYFFPTYAQGKKILWQGQTRDGKRFLDYIPKQCILGEPNDTELYVKLKTVNGKQSLIQVIGTDNIDSIVGTNPRGCVFSEYSLQNPRAWDFIRPILRENKGWGIFVYTPRGKNHGWTLYEMARQHPNWYCNLLDVTATKRDAPGEDGRRIITDEDIEDERLTGMEEELIQQEYFCKFSGSLSGSYYGRLIDIAEQEGRLGSFLWNPNRPVQTAWDIGVGDQTGIWFWQRNQKYIDLLEYYENHSEGLPFYAKYLKEKQYAYDYHAVPHDINVKEWGRGEKREDVFRSLLGKNLIIAKKLPIDEGIDMTRRIFPRLRFNQRGCSKGLDALNSYIKERDDLKQVFKDKPLHNWASHAADALRTLAVTLEEDVSDAPRQQQAETEFDPMSYEHNETYQSDFDPFRS